jgi:osmoprotectant transport system substrate-binding protein
MRRSPAHVIALAVTVAAVVAGGVAGCGTANSDSPSSQTIPSVTGKTVAATTDRWMAVSGLRTGSVTTGQATTTTAPVLPGTGKPTILLGDMNTPEQFILGQLYRLALKNEGYSVSLSRNIGPTSVSVEALKQSSLDIFPEYLDVWDTSVAGLHRLPRSLRGAYDDGKVYASKQKMTLLKPTPFSDTSGIAVLSTYAAHNQLRTLFDLNTVRGGVTFGGPPQFSQDVGGLPTIEQTYGFTPAATKEVAIGAQYAELRSGAIQAAYVNTTDPQLSEPTFRVLADPAHVFGFGNVVPVVRSATLAVEGPEFSRTINRVDALLTETAIRGLNAEVQLAHEDPESVAREFLQGNGLLPPPVYSTTG